MKEKITAQLWVIKFCLKVIYPKFNSMLFLTFLAVKYSKLKRKGLLNGRNMDTFSFKTLSSHVHRILLKDWLEDNIAVNLHKCLIISRNQFIDLASDNLFYLDKGLLWVTISMKYLKNLKHENNKEHKVRVLKHNLNSVTEEVHKKLWSRNSSFSLDKVRVVPIVGSKYVPDNTIFTTENELHNITTYFGMKSSKDLAVTFHPILVIEHAPKIAEKAEMCLIVNDYDLSNDFLKELLNNHFEIPKLAHLNDISSVNLTLETTSKHHYKYSDLVESVGKIYFKCTQLDKNAADKESNSAASNGNVDTPFFIVKGVTQLSLGESIHELKPKDEYLSMQDIDIDNTNALLLSSCPTGLKQKFDQMQESIAPFLSGNLNDLTSSLSSPIIPMLLLTGANGSGRHLLVKTLAKFNGMNCLQIDSNALQSSTAKQTESKIGATIQKAKAASPVVVLLDNFEVFAVDPENNEDCRVIEYFVNSITDLFQNYTKHPIIFVAVTEKSDLKPNILRIFLDKFHIPKLTAQQRMETLQWFVSVMQLELESTDKEDKPIQIDTSNLTETTIKILQRVAAKTETFIYGDMVTLIHFALREASLGTHNKCSESLPNSGTHQLREEHFNTALESMRSLQSQHLDAPNIPKVYWEDIGGLESLKKELLKTIEFPIKYPHLFKNSSLKRSGILLYGPPGCGKTLVAKAVSTELNVSFLSVKGPELLNMYIGQSEENVRRVFETARASSPCIVFLDELDAMAARRGAAGDSGGASDRLVSQLLAELDGVTTQQDADSSSFVFVMGATNRPDLLEPSLLRPGRLDKLIYVAPYCGLQEKTRVLTALCRSHKLRPEVNLSDVAATLPDRCTGADLLHVVATARSAAVRALVNKIQAGVIKESELSPDSVIIGVSEMVEGVSSFRPSVTEEELAHYESLQQQM